MINNNGNKWQSFIVNEMRELVKIEPTSTTQQKLLARFEIEYLGYVWAQLLTRQYTYPGILKDHEGQLSLELPVLQVTMKTLRSAGKLTNISSMSKFLDLINTLTK